MIWSQWHRLRGARRHMLALLQMAGHGGTVRRRTANKKLIKMYWPSRKRSPKRLIVLLEPKSGGARPINFYGASRRIGPPTFAPDRCPHFKIRSGATVWSVTNQIIFNNQRTILAANTYTGSLIRLRPLVYTNLSVYKRLAAATCLSIAAEV